MSFLILIQKYNMLRIYDQPNVVQHPLEKHEKCIEIPALRNTIHKLLGRRELATDCGYFRTVFASWG